MTEQEMKDSNTLFLCRMYVTPKGELGTNIVQTSWDGYDAIDDAETRGAARLAVTMIASSVRHALQLMEAEKQAPQETAQQGAVDHG